MAVDPVRISRRASDIRRQRERRRFGEADRAFGEAGETPEDGATLGEAAVEDEEQAIARSEALSAMVGPGRMQPHRPAFDAEGDPLAERFGEEISAIGREVSGMVNERLDQFREELGMAGPGLPKPFVVGSLYGAGLFGLAMVASLVLTGIRRRD